MRRAGRFLGDPRAVGGDPMVGTFGEHASRIRAKQASKAGMAFIMANGGLRRWPAP